MALTENKGLKNSFLRSLFFFIRFMMQRETVADYTRRMNRNSARLKFWFGREGVMRSGFLIGLILCWVGAVEAQSTGPSTDAPDLAIVKYSWMKDRLNWQGDPFGGTVENFDDIRRRMVDQRRMERARGEGKTGEAAKIEREMRSEQVLKARAPKPPRYAFSYSLSVKNTGAKTIKEIDWDYVFFDAVTGAELGRREFTAVEKIVTGKRKQLTFLITSPPTQSISVHALDKKERNGLTEQVVIMRVLYEDGSVWKRP